MVIEGIVIEDSQENQYAWIPVFEKSTNRIWGVDYSSITTAKTADNTAPTISGIPTPVSKANAVGYNYITQSQAQMLAEKMGENYGDTTSSIMFGLQWEAVCLFLEKYGKLSDGTVFDTSYLTDSTYSKLWENYLNSTFTMNRGYYNIYNSVFTGWTEKTAKKSNSESWLCTTGASEQNSALNIYDLGRNLYEWSLEKYSYSSSPATSGGGGFYNSTYASVRDGSSFSTYLSNFNVSARSALCL